MIYEMLHGQVAFSGTNIQQLNQRVRNGHHSGFNQMTVSGEAMSLIKLLLSPGAQHRPSALVASCIPWLAHA